MRSSLVKLAQVSSSRLAHGFGQLRNDIRGITKYHISPLEQRAFAGYFTTIIPNTVRRMRQSFFYVAPPFIGSYLVYDWVEKEHDREQRKKPGQFDHET